VVEVSAQKDLEDARRELTEVLDGFGMGMPALVRLKVREALHLLQSAAAKVDQAPERRDRGGSMSWLAPSGRTRR
jgi:hypothetical protein